MTTGIIHSFIILVCVCFSIVIAYPWTCVSEINWDDDDDDDDGDYAGTGI